MAGGPDLLPGSVGYLYWWTTSAVLFVLTAANCVRVAYRYRTRPRASASARLATLSEPPTKCTDAANVEKGVESAPRASAALRAGLTLCTLAEKYFFLVALPFPTFKAWQRRKISEKMPLSELVWTTLYSLFIFVLSFVDTNWDPLTVAKQSGWVAVAQVPLIIALAGKNNLISCLTGIGYEKLNFLHRAAGRTCLAGAWIHTIMHLYMNSGVPVAAWQTSLYQWGMVGLLAFSLLFVTSFGWVRQRLYEFFLVAHICLAALTLAGFILHWSTMSVWIYPGIGFWAADRLFRILRMAVLNHIHSPAYALQPFHLPSRATLSLVTPCTLRLTFPNPRIPWSAGQHFYVVIPGMSRLPWEAHPFTAATVPESGDLSFLVRVRDGFTGRMKQTLEDKGLGVVGDKGGGEMEVVAAFDGPYGVSSALSAYEGVVIFAGGSGVSYALAHLLEIINDAKAGRSRVRSVRIVWMIKSRVHLNWIAPQLIPHLHSLPENLKINLHLHVTKRAFPSSRRPDPVPIQPTGDTDFEAYLAQRAAQPRRMSRLGSTWSWATWTGRARAGSTVSVYDQTVSRRASEATLAWSTAQLSEAKRLPRKGIEAVEEDGGMAEEMQELAVKLKGVMKEGHEVESGENLGDLDSMERPAELATYTWTDGSKETADPNIPIAVVRSASISPSETPSQDVDAATTRARTDSLSPSEPPSDGGQPMQSSSSTLGVPRAPPGGIVRAAAPAPLQIFRPSIATSSSAEQLEAARAAFLGPRSGASTPNLRSPSVRTGSASSAPRSPILRAETYSARPGSPTLRTGSGSISARPGSPSLRNGSMSARPGSPSVCNDSISAHPESPSLRNGSISAGPVVRSTRLRSVTFADEYLLPLNAEADRRRSSVALAPAFRAMQRSADVDQPLASPSRFTPGPATRSRFGGGHPFDSHVDAEAMDPLEADESKSDPRVPKSKSSSLDAVDPLDDSSEAHDTSPAAPRRTSGNFLSKNPVEYVFPPAAAAHDSEEGTESAFAANPFSRPRPISALSAKSALHRPSTGSKYSVESFVPIPVIPYEAGEGEEGGQDEYTTLALDGSLASSSSSGSNPSLRTPEDGQLFNTTHPFAPAATTSEVEPLLRDTASLDPFITWHQGRADVRENIRAVQLEIGSGAISVNVCGPGSLLDSARMVVRDMSDVRSVMTGGTRLDFHAETFGW